MRQFASLAGISNPYLSQIERGLREPSDRVLDAIAAALQVSADTLYEQAGMTVGEEPETSAVEQAVREDPRLTGRQRQALLEVYRAFVAHARPGAAARVPATAEAARAPEWREPARCASVRARGHARRPRPVANARARTPSRPASGRAAPRCP